MNPTHPSSTQAPNLHDVLGPYRGKPVYLDAVAGNNGDDLIMHGAKLALDQLGLDRVSSPDKADAILINGSFKSDFWPMATRQVKEFSARFPDKPLVILPNTYLYEDGSFESAFADRRAPATLMCRERYSLEHLLPKQFPSEVRFGLDHDMALTLRDSGWIRTLRDRSVARHNVVVERLDHERSTAGSDQGPAKLNNRFVNFVYRSTPDALTQPVINAIERSKASQRPLTEFAMAAKKLVEERFPEHAHLPVLAADIARRRYTTFNGYAQLVANSGVVFASRMHVGVLGGMLGKPTFLVRGSHHKIIGVYEQSLADMPNVVLVDRECRPIEESPPEHLVQAATP